MKDLIMSLRRFLFKDNENLSLPYIFVKKILIALFYLGLWHIAATLIDNELVLSSPYIATSKLIEMIFSSGFWITLSNSISKILIGYIIAIVFGICTGIICHRYKVIHEFLNPFFSAMRSVPVACFIVIALIWIGSKWVSTLISIVIVMPMIHIATEKGMSSAPVEMIEMCDIYHIGYIDRLKHLYIPSSLSAISSSMISSLGMSIKGGIAAEVISSSDLTIGGELFLSKLYLDTPSLFAWTFVIVVASWLIEKILKAILDKISLHYGNNGGD